jgi:multiple sugar transport system permease protein
VEHIKISLLNTGKPSLKNRILKSEAVAFYGFISIWLLGIILLLVFPLIIAVVISFTNFNGMDVKGSSFIGLSNYIEAFHNPEAWYTMRQTLFYSFLSIPLSLITALGLALVLNKKIPGRGFYRTAFYLPTIIPIGAAALIFKSILDSNSGFLNLIISIFRPGTAINWLNDYGLYALVAMSIWSCGTAMVIFLAGLQGVPNELEEAAAIDGAGKWQIFRHVTWPILTPITYFQIVLGIINSLQMFIPACIMSIATDMATFWTPQHSMYMFPGYAMNQMMVANRAGYGVALIWIMFIVTMLITLIVWKSSQYWVHYSVEQDGGSKR